ncbi:MAG TPA: GFA family protein [Burkholderiaceae bacterium]|jgi:hypothetical protein|nr:GFA family protein [Burkholderiaceae bacterium]
MQHTYKGSCHCGRVTFGLRADLTAIVDCNCSLCSRKGALWHATDDSNFEILSGENDLLLYQFGTMTAKHYSCRHCGISTFSRPRIAPSAWVVNVRCLDGVDISSLKPQAFDGQNWEQSAKLFMQSHARGAV